MRNIFLRIKASEANNFDMDSVRLYSGYEFINVTEALEFIAEATNTPLNHLTWWSCSEIEDLLNHVDESGGYAEMTEHYYLSIFVNG